MKRELTHSPAARQPQRSRVTARRKMASLRIGTYRRLFRVAMNAKLVSAILEERNRHNPDPANEKIKGQEDRTGGAH